MSLQWASTPHANSQHRSRLLISTTPPLKPAPRACVARLCIRDNLRGFFEFCFPVLLKRVFGYDDVEASWLNAVTKVRRGLPVGRAWQLREAAV